MGDNRAEQSRKEKSQLSNNLTKLGREIKKCMISKWSGLMDIIKGKEKETSLLWLVRYWTIVIVSFIFIAFFKNSKLLSMQTIWMILVYYILIFVTGFMFSDKKLIIVWLSTPIPAIIFFMVVVRMNLIYYRPFICASLATGFSALFTIILYGEKMPKKVPELMHHRYLEYLRSFVWLVIFGSFGYYTWDIENKKNQVEMLHKAPGQTFQPVAAISYPPDYPLSTSLLQMGVVIFLVLP